jgi:thiamine transport system substrate-binding protein
MRRLIVLVITLGMTALVAPAAAAKKVTITLVTHDSFNVSKSVMRAFTRETGITVKVLRAGDAGQVVNQAILTKDEPIGDVLYGVDNTFLSRGLDAGIFERYAAKDLDRVPSGYVLDKRHRVTPIDRGDVCVNYDKQWFGEHGIEPPTTLGHLLERRYRDLLVVENPATSSPGLAFLLQTIAELPSNWQGYWADLRDNGVKVVDGWEQAWYDNFTAAGNGDRPLVVSYASSPPATVNKKGTAAQAGTLLDTCFAQTEFAGVLKGTEHRRAARRFIDFMLSEAFQAAVPDAMFVYPVREGVELPAAFVEHAIVPDAPLELDAEQIDENRDRWVARWTEIVVR